MSEQQPKPLLNELTAVSPLDGRYRSQTEALAPYVSESALIRTRVEVEARYLVALSEEKVIRPLQSDERQKLLNFGQNLNDEQVNRIKEIEDTTQHDVKAMERGFRQFSEGESYSDVIEMIHFGLTSEDINNLAYRLMIDKASREVSLPLVDKVVDGLVERAQKYRDLVIPGRTHGQFAVPTTFGKEFANFAVRLNKEARKAENTKLEGKLTGAVGNLNAHRFAVPDHDWIRFSKRFVEGLGFDANLFTTQIDPYEDLIGLFQNYQRINGVILNLDQDMWGYISDGWFIQEVRKGEVGSSTMPQKVNPIRFENSEGNVSVANSLFEGLSRKLSVSRFQRDLSDSTTIRNAGSALGYSNIAYRNSLEGLGRIRADEQRIDQELNDDWVMLTEGVQTKLRYVGGVEDPYSLVAGVARGQKVKKDDWVSWVDGLPVDDSLKDEFRQMSPETYTGYAGEFVDLAVDVIAESRRVAKHF